MRRVDQRWLAAAGALALAGCLSDGGGPLAGGDPFPGPVGLDGAFPDGGAPDAFFGDASPPPPPARLPSSPVQLADPPPPITGGTLAISADGLVAVAGDPDRDRVDVIDLQTRSLRGTVQLEDDAQPGRVVFDEHGQAHVVLRGGGVARIRLADATLAGRSAPCRHPRGLAFDPADASVLVTCLGGDLVRLGALHHKLRARHFVAEDLRDVLVTGEGTFVTRFRSAELLRLNDQGQIRGRTRPRDATLDPFLSIDPFVEDFAPEMLPTDPLSASPTLAWRTVQAGDDAVMLHVNARNEEIRTSPGGYGGGFGGCSGVAGASLTGFVDGEPVDQPVGLSEAALAVDGALSPDGLHIAIAAPSEWLQSGATLQLYSSTGVLRSQVVTPPDADAGVLVDDGGVPADGGFPPDGGIDVAPCSFPQNGAGTDEQVVAVAFGPDGSLFALSREPHRLLAFDLVGEPWDRGFVSLERAFSVELGGPSVRDTSHDLFHSNVGGGITCASCHGELTDDAHVWNFEGIGPRRTQNMRGGLLGTAPFHWDGDMITFNHLVDEVMTGRMGGFMVPGDMQQAMLEWIDEQPALTLQARDSAAAERGRSLFESDAVGCAICHAGNKRTDNNSYDVGTGGVFQVPSLLGLGGRGPYMHDGCAGSLRERFDAACGGGDRHGRTSQLSASQIDDLVAYLQSL